MIVMVRSRKVSQANDSGPVADDCPERRPLMRKENLPGAHGIGETPAEALARVANAWRAYFKRDPS